MPKIPKEPETIAEGPTHRVERVFAPLGPISRIRCDVCGRISYNPNDVAQGYCGACKQFHPIPRPEPISPIVPVTPVDPVEPITPTEAPRDQTPPATAP